MNKSYLPLLVLLVCFSCSPKEHTATGIISEASMNTLSIVSQAGDTLFFTTVDANKTEANGLLLNDTAKVYYRGKYTSGMGADKIVVYPQTGNTFVGNDKDKHGCIGSAGYTWCEVRKECIRLFEKGIRVKSVDNGQYAFIVFSSDSALAEIFVPTEEKTEILERRTLPSGGYAWNKEDDDTMNIRIEKGVWAISQRGKQIYSQETDENNNQLGKLLLRTYEGILPSASGTKIRYTLTVRNQEYSGDGTFSLTLVYPEDQKGKNATYSGKRFTLRGMPGNDNATVWQFVSDNEKEIFNFLYENENTLTLLKNDFKKNDSNLNYSLKLQENNIQ